MNAELSVRRATASDAEAVAQMVVELGYPADAETIRARLARANADSACLTAVAQLGTGQICGWIQARSSEVLESGLRVEIVGLVTASKMRRRGVGRRLVEYVEAWAKSLGLQVMVVRSNVNRVESHAFYPALGYAQTKTQHVYSKRLS